jgi:predicted transcriptional regulator of viral defense system
MANNERKIEQFLNNKKKQIYTFRELGAILDNKKDTLGLNEIDTVRGFIDFLIKESKLKKVELKFPNRKEVRYTWGALSIFTVLMSLNEKSYFSHYTAMSLNDLTEQIPKSIYLNTEQSPKPDNPAGIMEQKNIDMAFQRKPRLTKNIAVVDDQRIYHLSGKHSGNLGVIERTIDTIGVVRVTNPERTMIDCTVRPAYSGGVFEVLKAYREAKDTLSVNKLLSYLKKLNYTYPYHQAIGFYLERAGFSEKQLTLVKQFPMEYDFYLDYKMENPEYDSNWKIFYPSGI